MATMANMTARKSPTYSDTPSGSTLLCVFCGAILRFGCRNSPNHGLKHRSFVVVLEAWKLRAKVAWSARVVDGDALIWMAI